MSTIRMHEQYIALGSAEEISWTDETKSASGSTFNTLMLGELTHKGRRGSDRCILMLGRDQLTSCAVRAQRSYKKRPRAMPRGEPGELVCLAVRNTACKYG